MSEDYALHGVPFPSFPDAACVGVPVQVFFPARGGDSTVAKAICKTCPSRRACLDFALAHKIKQGIWGGKSERERRAMRRAAAHVSDGINAQHVVR